MSSLAPSAATAAALIIGSKADRCAAVPCAALPPAGAVLTPGADLALPGSDDLYPADTSPADSYALPDTAVPDASSLAGPAYTDPEFTGGPTTGRLGSATTLPVPPPAAPPTGSAPPPAPTLPPDGNSDDPPDPPAAGDADGDGGGSAAGNNGWGEAQYVENFDAGLADWNVYNGPGHVGNGRRSPAAAVTNGGVLTITGDSAGTTGGMAWKHGAKYGRWEARMRAPVSDPSYHAVLLLWPDAEDWPVGGEVDFAEMFDPARQEANYFLHYGASNSQVSGRVAIDATQWHNWAVEWTEDGITTFVDGQEWARTTDRGILPPRKMHLTIQLDWFPTGQSVKPSQMLVDWVAFYPVGTPAPTTTVPTTTVPTTTTRTTVPTTTTRTTTTTTTAPTTTTPPIALASTQAAPVRTGRRGA